MGGAIVAQSPAVRRRGTRIVIRLPAAQAPPLNAIDQFFGAAARFSGAYDANRWRIVGTLVAKPAPAPIGVELSPPC
jgi:hypothetical protein